MTSMLNLKHDYIYVINLYNVRENLTQLVVVRAYIT